MRIISHRGNLDGRNPITENSVDAIIKCVDMGFDVEIDLWLVDENYFLGHDFPQYVIERPFLENQHLWIHCKNIQALDSCKDLNAFFNKSDQCVLTSAGFLWTYPVVFDHKSSWMIAVANQSILHIQSILGYGGICTDYPVFYREELSKCE
jgi:hypothetical protein